MKKMKSQVDKIEHALYLAHRSQPQAELPEDWSQSVMHDIRRTDQTRDVQNAALSPAPAFDKMVLPFASAAGFAAIALVIYVLTATQGIEQQLFAIITGDPVGAYFMNLMGL